MLLHQSPSLFESENVTHDMKEWMVTSFSADSRCCESARIKLENKYLPITEVTDKFNRQSVSYQLSKKDSIHGWLKYKEGFSANLVKILIDEMNINTADTLLDPFMGSGTTLFVAQTNGINSIGFDVLPIATASMNVKNNIGKYSIHELREFITFISSSNRPFDYTKRVNYINITEGAYPEDTELDIPYFSELIKNSTFSAELIDLGILCILNSLEQLSYTSKDGQFLRWDERSKKVIDANTARIAVGKKPFRVILNKGKLPSLQILLVNELEKIAYDIEILQKKIQPLEQQVTTYYKKCNSLTELPLLPNDYINGVITSPPYCNRYDYTRIYGLELAYLGIRQSEINQMRQDLLSCTVENKTKIDFLNTYYTSLNREIDFKKIINVINFTEALNEVLIALEYRNSIGDINNKGVLRMVKGYFDELAFIFYELFRICKGGASVAIVNDNIRYAGEVIPVDFISTEIAQQIGFKPKKIYTLKQQKGNSSQQMKKFGRVPLRKSITIWEKPLE